MRSYAAYRASRKNKVEHRSYYGLPGLDKGVVLVCSPWRSAVAFVPLALPARRGLSLAALCLVVLLCQPSPAAAGLQYRLKPDHLESFHFELSRSVRTERAGHSLIQPFTTRVRGKVERYLARVFRDGTLGVVVRTVNLDGTIERAPASQPKPLDLGAVDGRSVSLRVDRSGALLASYGWLEVRRAGVGDLVDEALLFAVPRLPPQIPAPGQSVAGTHRIEIPIAAGLSCEQTWVLTYTRPLEPLQDCRGSCRAVSYEGSVREKCEDRARGMARTSIAEVQGQLEITGSAQHRRLRAHRWGIDWERSLASSAVAGDAAQAATQFVQSAGSLVVDGVAK